jgi:uncharacterized membrane protein
VQASIPTYSISARDLQYRRAWKSSRSSLGVIAAMFVGVLIAGGSVFVGLVAGLALLAVFLGLRFLRRERQELNDIDPEADEMVEPKPGEEPIRPG